MRIETEISDAPAGEVLVTPRKEHLLQVIRSGQCEISLFYSENEPVTMKVYAGAYFYTPPNFPAFKISWKNSGTVPGELLNFSFCDEDLKRQRFELPQKELLPADGIYDDLVFAAIRNLAQVEEREQNRNYLELLQNTLLFHLFKNNAHIYDSLQQKMKPMLELYVNENIHRKISIEELARFCGMSKSGFIRNFKREFDQTPLAFVKSARMERAGELIRTTPQNISIIAYGVGYQSPSQFSGDFRNYFGDTPRNYREKHYCDTL